MFPSSRALTIFILFFLLLAACGRAPGGAEVSSINLAELTPGALTASLSEVTGGILVRTAEETAFSEGKDGYLVQVLGQVQTQADGRARLDFSTGTLVRLSHNTLFTLQPAEVDSQGLLLRVRLELGRLWVVLQGGSLEVETKSGVAAVRGSYMSVSFDPESGAAKITCLEGKCSLATPEGSVEITAGQTATVTGAGEPPQVGEMSEQDVQEWLLTNPEAALVISALTETPVGIETPATLAVPSLIPSHPAEVVPPGSLPVVLSSTPNLTTTVVPPVLTLTRTVTPVPTLPPTWTATGTVTRTQTSLPTVTTTVTTTVTPTGTTTETLVPPLLTPQVEIISVSSAPSLGQILEVNVRVSPATTGPTPTGTISVTANGTAHCTVILDATGYALCSGVLALAGNISLEAHYSGDSQYYTGYSSPTGISISSAITTTTITSISPNPVTTGNLLTFVATVDNAPFPPEVGLPTGSVTFLVSSGDSCIITFAPWTCALTFTGIGPATVTAYYSGDTKFAGSNSAAVPIGFFIALNPPSSPPLTLWGCEQAVLERRIPKLFGCGWNVRSVSARLGE